MILPDDPTEHPSKIEFWISQANELKKAADFCWTLDESVDTSAVGEQFQGLAASILEKAADVNTELKWLYGNLIAFAIQYMSIGILIHGNPQRFLNEVPGNRIVELIEECGVSLTQIQKSFLQQIENTFEWDRKFPQWNVSINRETLHQMNVKHMGDRAVQAEDKKQLDTLFVTLQNLALDKIAETGKSGYRSG